jgi:CTP synthase (UTP-ammonia lyase)
VLARTLPPVTGPRVAIVGDRDPAHPTHVALDRAAARLPHGIRAGWIATEALTDGAPGALAGVHGLWIAPASPYRSTEGALAAIRHARERRLPLVGT